MNVVHEWLNVAKADLKTATLLQNDEEVYGNALYHTQQCAEKALKAYLAYCQKPLMKTHDLEDLVEICAENNEEFRALLECTVVLNPYATRFRYPDMGEESIDSIDVQEALLCAKKIYDFVVQKVYK